VGFELDLDWQKKGIMFEALSAVLSWGFGEMTVHRIEAQIHPENYPSIKLVNAIGFAQEGLLREVGHWGGQIHNMLQFGLLSNELLPMNAR
jgi:ribosomal-protein-alanine N-acetyltransferase